MENNTIALQCSLVLKKMVHIDEQHCALKAEDMFSHNVEKY